MRQRADNGGGQKGDQHTQNKPACARIAWKIRGNLGKLCRIDGQDGENCAKLDQNLEGFPVDSKPRK